MTYKEKKIFNQILLENEALKHFIITHFDQETLDHILKQLEIKMD